ncbi:MAG: DUF1990 family protein [Solirubrobacteraceae bacterium]
MAASWPFGIAWTSWHYLWRLLPVHRLEQDGSLEADLPPALPPGCDDRELQRPNDGHGPLLHRIYTARIADARLDAEQLIALVAADPNLLTPRQVARFRKLSGEQDRMRPGDEFLVHMLGPWDGPVRTVESRPDGFRFATLEGHLEAGQIEWRAKIAEDGVLCFSVESWARAGDRVSAFLHDRLRMAKEVQLYMWSCVCERAPRLAGGRLLDGVSVLTRRVAADAFAASGANALARPRTDALAAPAADALAAPAADALAVPGADAYAPLASGRSDS